MKNVTLETAQALKAAADQAGVTLPETEFFWDYDEEDGWELALIADPEAFPLCIPAPDAEELGEWMPEFIDPILGLSIIKDGEDMWTAHYDWYEVGKGATIAEALADLLIACIKADPGQIKTHLETP